MLRSTENTVKSVNHEENDSSSVSFEQMQLKVGQKLRLSLIPQIKPLGESYSNAYTSSLIGYMQDVTLIVSMPVADSLVGEPFIEGDQIRIRLFSGQSAYVFTAFVDKIVKLPFKYMHLSFPKSITAQNIRKSRRIRCHISGTEAQKAIAFLITDISTSGVGVESHIPIGSLGSEIKLSFTIPGVDDQLPFNAKGMIKSIKQIKKNNERIIFSGVEFLELEKKQLASLRHLIYQEIVEHPDVVL